MSYKKQKPVIFSEYEEHKQLVLHWFIVFLEDAVHIFLVTCILAGFILFPAVFLTTIIDDMKIGFTICFILIGIICITFLVIRIIRLKRVITYCRIMKKGSWMRARLDDLWVNRKIWPGYAMFYVTYVLDGKEHKGSYRCECLRVDSDLLGLRDFMVERLVHKYKIPNGTTVPIKVYNGKMIVINNDCGFYDMAHSIRRGDGERKLIYGLSRQGSYIDDTDYIQDSYW
ncbi:MAG: hypothetical protein IJV15_05600 [Lachnospiraceae bacterium]|nr:hypothetical protein [Lachnospiraceae bacterium]